MSKIVESSFTESESWAILYNGRPIKTVSGKSGWPSIGAAKNAMHNHIDSIIGYHKDYHYTSENSKNKRAVLKYLLDNKIIEIKKS